MRHKEYLEIIGDAMEDCNEEREREECLADAPIVELTDADLDDWYSQWEKRDIADDQKRYALNVRTSWKDLDIRR